MGERSDYSSFLKELFSQAGADLLRLMQGAADNAHLLRSDFYALRDWLEIAELNDQPVPHAILLLLLTALQEGSLCIEIAAPALERRLLDMVPAEEAGAWARRIKEALDVPDFATLIGEQSSDQRPVIAHTVGARRFLYFQKYLRAELDFQGELKRRLQQAGARGDDKSSLVQEVLSRQALPLDADQQRAINTALTSNFTIISGGPGTGKTTIVLTLLRCLVRGGIAPSRVALAAPTGRAAQRLTDALRAGFDSTPADADPGLRELKATTLHQLLGYRPNRNSFVRHRENPIPADVVIIDEVSMVGLVPMAQLLQALPAQATLILLGDKDQLPSVDAGAILAHLAPLPSLQERVVELRTNHRSQRHIREVADAINRQDAAIVERLPTLTFPGSEALQTQGCVLLEQIQGTPAELRGVLQFWVEQAFFISKIEGRNLAEWIEAASAEPTPARCRSLFALLDRFRLLTLIREGVWGCDEINRYLAHLLGPRLDGSGHGPLFAGAPVLITRNDEARGLFNGDVGITLRQRGGLRVYFPRPDGAVSFPAESLPAHDLAFAMTVHKSQGSEYANVLLMVPPQGGKRLLTKELIYTAITRAKSLAIICSTEEVLKFAINRRILRESGVLQAELTSYNMPTCKSS